MERTQVRLLALDVDGVLTNGSIILDGEREIKSFDVQDGLGVQLAARAGIVVAIVSTRDSAAVRTRAAELGITEVHCGRGGKKATLAALLERAAVPASSAAFVGDDLVDLPAMNSIGWPIAVANARDEVKAAAAYVASAEGGSGAVREVVEWILKGDGRWDSLLREYLDEQEAL